MKMFKYISLQIIVLSLGSLSARAQQVTQPKSFDEFYKKDSVALTKGTFNIYRIDQQYFMEIPDQLLERDILITMSASKGTANYVSPESGTIYLRKSAKQKIEVYKNMVLTVSADTSDYCMMSAIEKSGLIPVYKSYSIVARGEKKHSSIIDITSELNGSTGLFDVQKFNGLNAPDPQRSKVLGCKMIDGGAVFQVKRVQTSSYTNGQSGEQEESVSSFVLDFVFQLLPEHDVKLKENHPTFGFNTIERQEYDSKKYRSFQRKYLQRWNLEASKADAKKQKAEKAVAPLHPIQIYVDPNTPAAFRHTVKNAVGAWAEVFEAAGWKDVFVFTDEPSLSYKKIVFDWRLAYNENGFDLVSDPVSGEILSARVHFMDASAVNEMYKYFVACGTLDERIRSNPADLELRKEILTRQLIYELGCILGLKKNTQVLSAYSPTQVRSKAWVSKNGFVPSIMGGVVFNYLAQLEDHLDMDDLISKIGIYDYEAIDYAYGDRSKGTSLKAAYYVPLSRAR